MVRNRDGLAPAGPSRAFLKTAVLVLATGAAVSCAGSAERPDRALTRLWADYEQLPSHRALAVAGDTERRERWVAGATGGHATVAQARERALEECRERRLRRRVQEACRIYAVDDRIVGGPRP